MVRRSLALAALVLAACSDTSSDTAPTVTDGSADAPSADGASDGAGTDDGGGPGLLDGSPLSKFAVGHVFIAGSRNAEIFELDETLALVTRWTDPAFGSVLPAPGQSFAVGPAGMAFDASGNLVVAAVDQFCVFSAPNVKVACHPKVKSQATENVIFDHLGNLYTTTSTGGTNEIHKYDSSFRFVRTFTMPSGEITGVTCDPEGNLFLGSQNGGSNGLYKVDRTTLQPLENFAIGGTVEGLQYADGDTIWAALQGSIVRIAAAPPHAVTKTLSDPGLKFAVPVTIDAAGNVYTADYENGTGTAPADLYVFRPDGSIKASRKASEIYGPFGIVVGGTRLPCGAYRPPR